jgi:Uma2 family endonuclease
MQADPMSVVTVDFGNALLSGEVSLRLPEISGTEFYEFCQRNPDLNVELSQDGAIILMPPANVKTDLVNMEIVADFVIWNRALPQPGFVFGPSAGFTLPNGAVRSPDTSWVSAERWNALTDERKTNSRRYARTLSLK